jgi:LacI family transcriptional regulator
VLSISAIDLTEPSVSTISDVARRAGVSPATVSRYLQGVPVRAEDRVRDAIAALDFRPNAVARSLKSGSTMTIGLVIPDVTNPFFAAVVKGVESVARGAGYTTSLFNTDESIERESELVEILTDHVDGLILAPVNERDRVPERTRGRGVPIVFVDRDVPGSEFDAVLIDNYGGGRIAGAHLLDHGHERVAIISGPLESTPGRGRFEGFADVVREAGLELGPDYMQPGDFRTDGGYQAMLRLLGLAQPPTGIFVANNLMTIGALRALHEVGVRVPEQLSVVGFDDLDVGDLLAPPLTVVDRPMEEQGVLAMRLLLSRLDRTFDGAARRIVLDTRLLARGSCSRPQPTNQSPSNKPVMRRGQ